MERSLLFLICIFCLLNCFSQNRNNTWYFGNQAGLDFNTNPPTVLSNSQSNSYEASATISDNNGNLLFYTDGVTVWNRNQGIMLNGTGLAGGTSAAQAALIIPKPCDNNIYYIFTVPERESGLSTFAYSIVDMSLDGGLGAITVKNVFIHTPTSEKLTGIIKSNGTEYWIIIKEAGSDAFLAYTLNALGFDPNPVTSNPGGSVPSLGLCTGYIKVSHDGSKLCTSYTSSAVTELFDFNNSTGIVSNPISFPFYAPYAVEFSPDNSKLYLSAYIDHKIYQYNLLAGSPTAIQNSQVVVVDFGAGFFAGSLKLAPDNKIYASKDNSHYISVIDQPDQSGLACNFIDNFINLGAGLCLAGLPNNLDRFVICNTCPAVLNTVISNINICSNQTYQLPSGTVVNTPGIYLDTIRNSPGTCDSIIYAVTLSVYSTSLLDTTVHICPNQSYTLPSGMIVSTEGIYIDTLRNIAGCDSIINTVNLFVDHVSLQNTDVHICPNQTYTLLSGMIVSAEGIYLDTLRSQASCDSIINTIHLFVDLVVLQNGEVHICPNQTYQLPSGTIVSTEGIYLDTLRSQAYCDSIINSIHLFIDHATLLNKNATICSNQTYMLPSGTIVTTGGIYLDTVRNQASCDSIINTIQLIVNDQSYTSHTDSIFAGQNYTLPSGIVVSAPGTYQSILTNSLGCDSIITTTLTIRKTLAECITLKNAITPNGDGINDYWVLYRFSCFKRLAVSVYNRYGSPVYHSDDYKNDWNGKYKNKELPDGTYYYVMKVIAFDGKEHVFKDNLTILR